MATIAEKLGQLNKIVAEGSGGSGVSSDALVFKITGDYGPGVYDIELPDGITAPADVENAIAEGKALYFIPPTPYNQAPSPFVHLYDDNAAVAFTVLYITEEESIEVDQWFWDGTSVDGPNSNPQ